MKKKVYGMELILDLEGCRPEMISSKKKIEEFVNKLCRLIKMQKYGKPFIERFGFGKGYTAGYSLVQLIETSSIVAHFSELWNKAFINIFSCKLFDEKKAKDFTIKFFGAKKVKNRLLIR
ncbi:MAG: S-adenosylmethionine decarboxylase [Candidatus Omnitrophica bacterium]|nr:S-adenosylmethionine decarboxylase [Candidatus Omnitrophota bacterium]